LLNEIFKKAEWEIEDKKPNKDWPNGNIKFNNYSLKYREELDYVLKNLNIDIKSGEKVIYFNLFIFNLRIF
jgi:ATP-binding cassette subfamily C (CFTR/MRP) protein 1